MNNIDQHARLPFDPEELRTLQQLRSRYQEDHDSFSHRERAHLRFVRWLIESGGIPSPTQSDEASLETQEQAGIARTAGRWGDELHDHQHQR